MAVSDKTREIFSRQLLKDFRSLITGEDVERVVGENPEDRFFVGKLISLRNGMEENQNLTSKSFIQSIGADFYVANSELNRAVLDIYPIGDFYYRVYPTLEEQRTALLNEINKRSDIKYSSYAEVMEASLRENSGLDDYAIALTPVFQKVRIHAEEFCLSIKLSECFVGDSEYGYIDENSPINKVFAEYVESLAEPHNENLYKYIVREKTTIKDLADKNTYRAFLLNNAKKDVRLQQNWNLYLDMTLRKFQEKTLISVNLVNNSSLFSNGQFRKSDNKSTIESLFNSGLKIALKNAVFEKIELDYFLDDYKYDKRQAAIGNNCTVYFDDQTNTITTDHLPVYPQKRLVTRIHEGLDVTFARLIAKPIETLENIYQRMQEEYRFWCADDKLRATAKTETAQEKLKEEIETFKEEIGRFRFGIDILNKYPILLQCFKHMNETFRQTSKKFNSWRLFQIVFIVSVIPDIAACDPRILSEDERGKSKLNAISLLYYPTGGGKTEAFLGILIFNLFYDRYRGKNCGVTGILRYPLRLLSVQQVQRLANVLAQAELIRRSIPEIKNSDAFSLGYFVGDINTPNRLSEDDIQRYESMTEKQLDEERVIDICPFCGKATVHLKPVRDEWRLVHYCSDPECPSGGVLPLFIVDNEIYRYLPSAVISTVDKLAILGNNKKFRAILNGVSLKCPKHGYTSSSKCVERGCDVETFDYEHIRMYDPAPTLFIQDELHLIRESLGTYASHYESFIDYYLKNISCSRRGAKIIGATATISSYEEQVSQLYLKEKEETIRFPAASPYLDHNFYAYSDKDDTQRFIMGYAPYGRSVVSSVASSLKYMRMAVHKYLENPELMMQISGIGIDTEEEARKVLEDYWILLEYNNVKRDGNMVEGEIDNHTNNELRGQGIPHFSIRKMTGDETFQNVREVLAEVENSENVFEGVNMISATSMISHGVDADRFNVMFFYGIPGNTAEYIQAYSRTGRKHSSIVVDIIRPARETDCSYLKNFIMFHDYKDILVDAVPINRWATKAVKSTLPGILTGLLLNQYDLILEPEVGTLFFMKNIKKAITNNLLDKQMIKEQLIEAYGCNSSAAHHLSGQYKLEIERFVDDIFMQILDRAWTDEAIFAGFTRMGYRIMNSLRDTDVQLIIEAE